MRYRDFASGLCRRVIPSKITPAEKGQLIQHRGGRNIRLTISLIHAKWSFFERREILAKNFSSLHEVLPPKPDPGSEVVAHFATRDWQVAGVDSNLRADFFGPQGRHAAGTSSDCRRAHPGFTHNELDIRDRNGVLKPASMPCRPDLVVHTAAQPSHDLAASRPFDDFDVNAVGALNLLEACRQHAPEAVFVRHEHQQGLRRPTQYDPLKELPHTLGL